MHGTSVTSLFQALIQATTRLISTVRTAKELDEETGLYYYGARYLDPKYSLWISTDPALVEYIPKAPIDEEAKKYNQNLPGMGVFNHINDNLYAQAVSGLLAMTNLDFGTDWGNAAVYFGASLLSEVLNGIGATFGSLRNTFVSNFRNKENISTTYVSNTWVRVDTIENI